MRKGKEEIGRKGKEREVENREKGERDEGKVKWVRGRITEAENVVTQSRYIYKIFWNCFVT